MKLFTFKKIIAFLSFIIILLIVLLYIKLTNFGAYTTYMANSSLKEYNLYPHVQIKYGRKFPRTIGWVFYQSTPRYLDDDTFHKILPILRSLDYTKPDYGIFIQISNSAITDRCFENLAPFPEVTFLDISCTDITNDSIEHLKCFPKLRWLNIRETAITTDMLENLFSNHEYLICIGFGDESIYRNASLPSTIRNEVHNPKKAFEELK